MLKRSTGSSTKFDWISTFSPQYDSRSPLCCKPVALSVNKGGRGIESGRRCQNYRITGNPEIMMQLMTGDTVKSPRALLSHDRLLIADVLKQCPMIDRPLSAAYN